MNKDFPNMKNYVVDFIGADLADFIRKIEVKTLILLGLKSDSKSDAFGRGGSTPPTGTTFKIKTFPQNRGTIKKPFRIFPNILSEYTGSKISPVGAISSMPFMERRP